MDLPTIFTSWRGYCQRNHWLRGQYAKGILHYRSIGLLKKGWAALWRYYQSCLRRRTIVKTEDSGRKFYRRKILKKYYKELLLWWSHAQGVGKEWRRRYLLIKGLGIWIRSTLERQENKQRVTISKKIFLKKIWKSLQEHLLHSGVSWRADKDHMDLAAIFHQLVLCKIGLTRLSLYRSLTLRSSIHSKRHEVLQRQIQNKRKNSLFRAYRMMSHRAGMKRTRFLKLLKFHEQLAKEALSYWVSYGSKCSAQREVVISSDCYVRRRRQLLCLKFIRNHARFKRNLKERMTDLVRYRFLWLKQRCLEKWRAWIKVQHNSLQSLRIADGFCLTSSLSGVLNHWRGLWQSKQARTTIFQAKITAAVERRQCLQQKYFFQLWKELRWKRRIMRKRWKDIWRIFQSKRREVLLKSCFGAYFRYLERRSTRKRLLTQAKGQRSYFLLETHMSHFVHHYWTNSCVPFSVPQQRRILTRAVTFRINQLYRWSLLQFSVHVSRVERQRRGIYHAIWFWKYWRELLGLMRWRRVASQRKKRREDIREAYLIHQRWQSQEILRRWTCSICGPPNCRVLDRRIASRRKVSRNITGLVRACALHWLHLTRERQRKRIMAAASSYSLITSLPPAVSSKIPLAHLPPRRLPTELLGDIIPEEFSSSEAKLSSPDRFPVVPTPSYPPSPPPPEVHSLEENPIVSLADIDRLVEGLYIKIMSGSAQNITPSERQEFYLLLTQYGELVESLKSRDASRISSLL